MATLATIAAGYRVPPSEFARAVGLDATDLDLELGPELTAQVVNAGDESEFFGPLRNGRHRLR